jgi:peptide/nickel transport system substrate-binding protein
VVGMKRRTVLKAALGGAAALAAPSIVRAADATTLTFAPQADVAALDPVWTTADVTRNHAFMVFDTLYGLDDNFQPHPQMVEGHTISADKLEWNLTLRDGLKFHDGTPVLARDVVASVSRWEKRDTFGAVLAAATDELSAPSDKVVKFRLKKPFALLPDALAVTTNMCPIMPERLPKTDAFTQVTEMVGSGPFRFVPSEHISGSKAVYHKFDGYVPRTGGPAQGTCGPKTVHFDRVEWTVIPDPATKAQALINNEIDWWENPVIDLVPQLKGNKDIVVTVKDHTGEIGCLRFNELFPPFDNPAIRRIVASAVEQRGYMEAVAGAAPDLIMPEMGLFVPKTPMANDVGLSNMVGLKDVAKLKKQLADAGYKGEKIIVMVASDFPTINAIGQVGVDMMQQIGLNVEQQALDWGTVVQRRASKEPPDKGGWNVFFTFLGGPGNVSPASNIAIRASGGNAWFGWPNIPKLEALRLSWFDAPDLAAQQKVCEAIQAEWWNGPTFANTGGYFQPTAFRNTLTDIPEGIPQFYRVRRV